MKKVKELLKTKSARMALVLCLSMSMLVVGASAAEGDLDVTAITTAFTTGFQSMVTNSIAMISAMVPIALTLAGVVFLVKKAMGWFRSMAK